VAEAVRRELDVESASPGAVMLNHARATFIAKDCLILHEQGGTLFDQAFLVAHEIGHAEFGDAVEGNAPAAIDPARSAEPSPTGLDRVVDYGRRQRREVQMDLFAREFLLPRTVVRKLHLEENLTATEIAEFFSAPFEVVAQQLLDALLLPPIILGAEAEKVECPPNPLQREAAGHRGAGYLLMAGPGTGKTQTLATRVEGLLHDGGDPRRILLLTFSNKAAGEMAERIARKHPEAAAAMWIGTFHAFGLDLVRRFHSELGLREDPRMLDRTEAVELLEQEFPRLDLFHYRDLYDPTQNIADILAAVSRAKDEVVDDKRYAELAEAMRQKAASDEERVEAEKAIEVARVYAAYEVLKRKANCVDFGDLVLMPVRLLEGHSAIRAHCQAQYDHVLVDEYQDVNRSSIRLLTALRGQGDNLWVVGDAKQSIYRFRGASSFNLARFGREDFPGGLSGHLEQNYRSVSEIVGAFSEFASGMKTGGLRSGLKAVRGASGHKPELRLVDRTEAQTVALAESIEEMRRSGFSYRSQAVLCTGNETLSKLGQDLERLGIPVLFLGSLFERPEIKDLLSLLSLLTDRRAMGLVRIACRPEFRAQIADVAMVLDHLRTSDLMAGVWLRDIGSLAGLSPQGRTALAKLAATLDRFAQDASPWRVLATVLLDRTRMAAELASSPALSDKTRAIAIWQLMNFVRVQPAGSGLPIARLLDRIRRLLRLGDDRDLRQLPVAAQGIDAVRLMTIHGAKGLEFPVVHLPGLNADTLPRVARPSPCPAPDGMIAGGEGSALEVFRAAHAEEQECLFYVAMSRARDRLFIYAPTQKSNGNKRGLSPFLARLGPGLVRRQFTPSRDLPPARESADVELAIDGGLRFSGQQVALYEKCPRRFFYTHVLAVGGRRTATGFMQMHDAVRTVFQSIIADGPLASDAELEGRVREAFRTEGLAEHGYVEDYRNFALKMLRYFALIRKGQKPEAPTALRLTFGLEEIIVRPDDVLVRGDGVRTLRSVRTGHRRTAESKDVAAAAFILAARKAFPRAVVELVYLSDEAAEPLSLSDRELESRHAKLDGFLRDIRGGRYPAESSARVCPGCPAFFICGPTPPGILQKRF